MSEAASAAVLFTFRRCPYAMRARLALHASQISYEHREVDLKNKPIQLLSLSPKATVPVLWLRGEGGRVIEESLEIMHWALAQGDPKGWLPKDETTRARALELIQLNDGPFKGQLDRYKYPTRFALTQEDSLIQRDAAAAALMKLEGILCQTSYLSGEKFGMLDAAIAPFIRQFAKVDFQWFVGQSFKHLINWLNDFESSQLFIDVMKKYPTWVDS